MKLLEWSSSTRRIDLSLGLVVFKWFGLAVNTTTKVILFLVFYHKIDKKHILLPIYNAFPTFTKNFICFAKMLISKPITTIGTQRRWMSCL